MTDADQPFVNERFEEFHTSVEELHARHESTRQGWNEGAAKEYTPAIEATAQFILKGRSNLHPVERIYLGELLPHIDTAIHLQCASGRDTLSLLNEGVKRVIGVDISDVMIENARRTSDALNLGDRAAWYRSDVLETPHELDGVADLVYTGRGALCWMMDLDAWAAVVARLLKPGGVVSVFDGHPLTWLFKQEAPTLEYSGYSYFPQVISGMGWGDNYIGELGIPLEQQSRKYESNWPVSKVFAALTKAGLRVERFGEHPETYYDEFPNFPPELLSKFPSTFSMLARKP